jgi:hypothetical protein
MADLIHAGEIGDAVALIDDSGALILRTPGQDIVLDRAYLAALLARVKPVADLVARSPVPISGMSVSLKRSLNNFGCKVVADA